VGEKIFEPFFTTKQQGTGLGLAVVQAIANAHHGKLKLAKDVKQGAKFDIHLPILDSIEPERDLMTVDMATEQEL
jgi:two-component system sensor histidine kinase FlrB